MQPESPSRKSPATAPERWFADAIVTMHERRTSEVPILLTTKPDAKPRTSSASADTAATIKEVRVNAIDLLAIGSSVPPHYATSCEQSGSSALPPVGRTPTTNEHLLKHLVVHNHLDWKVTVSRGRPKSLEPAIVVLPPRLPASATPHRRKGFQAHWDRDSPHTIDHAAP